MGTGAVDFEINPNVFAAPRHRPPGMDPKVGYQPMLESRSKAFDWVTNGFLKAYYDSRANMVPQKVLDWMRRKENAPIHGTPGADLPDPTGAYRVAVIGDMGEGAPAQARIATQLTRWAPTHVATVGDNVYPLGRERDWADRFDRMYGDLRMSTQWNPALGNHDYYAGDLRPYFSRFPHLRGHAYYTWNLGPAQFFVLDTEQRLDPSSAQHAWLAAQLAQSTAKFKVLQMHRPMVSSRAGSIGRNMHGSLGPLLAKHGVQLVLAGHEHGFERTKAVDGTVHVVTGGGGAASYAYPGSQPEFSVVRSARHHYLQLNFDDTEMVIRAVDDKGAVIDTSRIRANAASDAVRGAATLAVAA